MSPTGKTQQQEEQKPTEVTAQSLSDKPVTTQLPDTPPTIEVHEYSPPDPRVVKDADPDFANRWLSKKKLERDRDTRGWEIVQGHQRGHSQNPQAGFVPKATGDVDTTRSLGDLILARAPKAWAESRRKYYQEQSNQSVREVTVRDEKENSERTMEYLRKDMKMSKFEAERFVQCHGGAVVMTGRR